MRQDPPPRVAILLATFQGERFLAEQIATLAAQSHAAIDVLASDDGSSDGTTAILERHAAAWSKGGFRLARGPGRGFAENFRSLILSAPAEADVCFFCDQDDLWDPDKVAVAVATLATFDAPALYCGRTRTVDERGRTLGLSALFSRPPSFRNALVQSIGGGNTMALNAPAFALLRESARRTGFVSHDWWSYMLVSGAGGRVVYDPVPHVGYRQHGANLVGSNKGPVPAARRLAALMRGRFAGWTETNLAGLELCFDLLEPSAREIVLRFRKARGAGPLRAPGQIARLGLYRQSRLGSAALYAAAAMEKL